MKAVEHDISPEGFKKYVKALVKKKKEYNREKDELFESKVSLILGFTLEKIVVKSILGENRLVEPFCNIQEDSDFHRFILSKIVESSNDHTVFDEYLLFDENAIDKVKKILTQSYNFYISEYCTTSTKYDHSIITYKNEYISWE